MIERIEIESFEDSRLDLYARSSERKLAHYYEPAEGLFIAESSKVIERALEAGYEPASVLVTPQVEAGEAADFLAILSEKSGEPVPVLVCPEEVLKKLTGFPMTRGALCAMKRGSLPEVSKILEGARRIAILDNLENPTNVGAIFRSAAALNMDAVLLTPGSSDPLQRRATRVSMGTVFQIPWTYIGSKKDDSPADYLKELKALGWSTASMALRDDTVDIDDPVLENTERLAVILGNEGDGLPDETLHGCDFTIRIPMSHRVDSLNVAAAAAVAFWELGKQK